MGVAANTFETYQNSLVFEDLQNAYTMLSPTKCPFQSAIGTGNCSSTLHEWPVVELNDADPTNRVIEGEDAPATDPATNGRRLSNFTQISDKKVIVSHTSAAVDAAADNLQKIAKQVAFKMSELKRDVELMLLQNIAASAGASGTARVAAGFPAFLKSNTTFTAGGADPVLSGVSEGYPSTAAVAGTLPAAFTEAAFNDAMQEAWTNGGEPSMVLVNANNKRIISETFTGNATRYQDNTDKKLLNAVDFYESDFGTVTIVPTRFMLPTEGVGGNNYQVLGIDPEYVELTYLESLDEAPLAKTGHNEKRLIWMEYTLSVLNEAAHFILRDTDGVMPAP